jgi:TLC domain
MPAANRDREAPPADQRHVEPGTPKESTYPSSSSSSSSSKALSETSENSIPSLHQAEDDESTVKIGPIEIPLEKQIRMRDHDYFNIVCLIIIVILDAIYLIHTTDLHKLGTDELGIGYDALFQAVYLSFASYLVADLVWVYLIPDCVLADPKSILIHHLVTLVFISYPLYSKKYSWHMAITVSVECNTLALITRRNCQQGSIMFHISNISFYITWGVFRLVLFPILTYFFSLEYLREVAYTGTYYNAVILAPMLQGGLTSLSLKWTYDIIAKMLQPGRPPSRPSSPIIKRKTDVKKHQ